MAPGKGQMNEAQMRIIILLLRRPEQVSFLFMTYGLEIRRGRRARSEKVMRQSEVLQPRPLISTSQWRCKKCLNWSSLWEGLQMEMLGLGMQICRWAWLAQSGQPESVTVPVSGELQCSDCAPSLVWGEQLLPMRPAKQSLVVACGQAWKINTGF